MVEFNQSDGSAESAQSKPSLVVDTQAEESSAPLISLSPTDESPSPISIVDNTVLVEGDIQGPTVVDQLSELLDPAVRRAKLFEADYVRPWIRMSLGIFEVSPPVIQYLETPLTAALLLTVAYCLSAAMFSAAKELIRFSAILLVYFIWRGSAVSFRLLGIALRSIWIFVQISLAAIIGKAVLGFVLPSLSVSGTSNGEQWSASANQAREQLENLRTYASEIDLRNYTERLVRWMERLPEAVDTFAALFKPPRSPASNGGSSTDSAFQPRASMEASIRRSSARFRQAAQSIRASKQDLQLAFQPIRAQLARVNWKRMWAVTFKALAVVSFFIFRWKTKLIITSVVGTYKISKSVARCCTGRRRGRRASCGHARND